MPGRDSAFPRNLARNRFANVFTDVQFWVPVAVLLAGLVLLEWIR
jgi:hypothetical protein